MPVTPPEKLVESVASEMTTYLKAGRINPDFVEKNLQFKGLGRIQDMETILKIHFVLAGGVVNFTRALPERVRRIKRENRKYKRTCQGEVRGTIMWGETSRKQQERSDGSIFVCGDPQKDYNIDENLVLKELLYLIYQTLENELETAIGNKYEWLAGWLSGERNLLSLLREIYFSNIHIRRVRSPIEYAVTDRQISRARNSRKPLYREAAELLADYRRLIKGEFTVHEMERLLEETLIIPKDSTIFELYSIFRMIKYLEMNVSGFTLMKIERGRGEVAFSEIGDRVIRIYHDSTGGLRFFEGFEGLEEEGLKEWGFFDRYRKSKWDHRRIMREVLGKEVRGVYEVRPDIVIRLDGRQGLEKLILGQVKYTDNEQTLSEGLEELIRYLYYAQVGGQHILGGGDAGVRTRLMGVMVVDNMDLITKKLQVRAKGGRIPIKIFTTEDLENLNLELII